MTNYFCSIVGVALTLSICSACAEIGAENTYYREGWRSGRISKIETEVQIDGSTLNTCQNQLVEDMKSHKEFAVVMLFKNQKWVASLPADHSFKVGDSVRVNVNDCLSTMIPR